MGKNFFNPYHWLRNKISGEMMRIRGTSFTTYTLDSSKVDYQLARELYQNKNKKYELGSAFIKPVINSTVGFMGVPHYTIEDEDAQELLNDFSLENTSKMIRTHSNALKLGDCYVWITREKRNNPLYPEKKERLIYNIIPPEEVKDIILDPITREPIAYILESKQEWTSLSDVKKTATIKQTITAEERTIEITGDKPEGIESGTFSNTWGFIPIIHFKNEPDETMKFGQSDIEPIEPYIKAYHDVMIHALKGSKMHSTPKLKLKLKDVAGFLANNFGIEDPVKFAKEGGTINLDGHEILFFTQDEDAQFIEVKSATGDAKELLKMIFYCIVDISETPEFIFGVHTPSALASVKEQMPIMVNKIKRKREQFAEQWQLLARMVLAMSSQVRGYKFSDYTVSLGWDEVDPRDDKAMAETLKHITSALNEALNANIISEEAAVNFLSEYVDTMGEYLSTDPEVPGEREKIMRTRRMRNRFRDHEGWVDEVAKIDEALLGDEDE
ncbi:phage portal protein [Clostridium formicaceticum]|uniref:Phage portal protein n=1 Tax=Clostridium formicaceticum TaxID=1497 RepID=A0AAC9RP02_9CLOT|nr:phage portal protein [Clostridium formicaceticum]AOY77201.1 phage portal protein [Clostridium formicaceticum]ARE87725.1 Phage portal protein, SPP1 Gp6-like [Clostridium formicaceticum]